jgi:competence protein ComEA
MKKIIQLLSTCILLISFTLSADDVTPVLESVSTHVDISVIDINTADVKALSSLKGIGTKKAEAIIEYRMNHGKFTSIEDLSKVEGIGKKVVDKNISMLSI